MLRELHEAVEQLRAEWHQRAATFERHGAYQAAKTYGQAAIDLAVLVERVQERLDQTPEQYARARGVQPATVRQWLRRGRLAGTKTAGGDWIIPYGAVPRPTPRRVTA